MIPVRQTRFGKGNGNCLLACVASILHRPLEEIPDFAMSGLWFEDLYEWCKNEGIGLLCVNPQDFESSIILNTHCIMIFTVQGIENEDHAVVGKCSREEHPNVEMQDGMKWRWVCEPVFDPNPIGVKVDKLEHLIFLVEPLEAYAAREREWLKKLEGLRELSKKATAGEWRTGREDMQSYDGQTGEAFRSIYCDDKRARMHLGERLPFVVARLFREDEPDLDTNMHNAAFIVACVNLVRSAMLEEKE